MRGLLLGAALCLPALLSAQVDEISITGGWSAFGDNTIGELPIILPDSTVFRSEVKLENGFRAGARVTFNTRSFFGHEINYAFQHCSLATPEGSFGAGIHNYYYNYLAYATRRYSLVRPFITGGVGFSDQRTATKFGVNFGGGLKFKLSERYGFRLDVRDHVTGKPFDFPNNSGLLHNVEYSAGFSLIF